MLPKEYRLTRRAFRQNKGTIARFAYGTMRIFASDRPQFAVVVSKKTARSAPSRNRIRRRVYSALQNVLDRHPGTVGAIIYPNQSTKDASPALLVKSISDALGVRE